MKMIKPSSLLILSSAILLGACASSAPAAIDETPKLSEKGKPVFIESSVVLEQYDAASGKTCTVRKTPDDARITACMGEDGEWKVLTLYEGGR